MQNKEYVCTLDERSIRRAREELNEDPEQRAGAVNALRDWVIQQNWLRFPTDEVFLLGILRIKKFSQLRAREYIKSLLTILQKYPEWYRGNDPADPSIQRVWQYGVFMPLPKKDQQGRRVVLIRAGRVDPTGASYSLDEYIKANTLIMNYIMLDEYVQVNGLVMLIDLKDFTMKHQQFFGFETSRRTREIIQNAALARFKEFHFFNAGLIVETVFPLMKGFLSQKLQKRIHVHGNNLESLFEKVDMSLLPDEYLPDDYTGTRVGTAGDILENVITEMQKSDNRRVISLMHSSEWWIDRKLEPTHEPQTSYRKLIS
ncbi:hypothetical protein ScPMuIL_001596 [Solemya velum]